MNTILYAACPIGGCPALPTALNMPVTIGAGFVILAIVVVTVIRIVSMFRSAR